MYTHEIKKSGQKCFRACWWPIGDDVIAKFAAARESLWPMMMLESGQVTRVNANNLIKINRE